MDSETGGRCRGAQQGQGPALSEAGRGGGVTVPPPLPPQPPGPHLPWGWKQCHGLTPLGAASTRRVPSCRGCLAGCGGDGPGKGVAGSGTSRTATAAEQCGLADLQRSVPGILGSSRQPFKRITSDQRRGQGRASVTTPVPAGASTAPRPPAQLSPDRWKRKAVLSFRDCPAVKILHSLTHPCSARAAGRAAVSLARCPAFRGLGA